MFVLTADQIGSRSDIDRVPEAFELLAELAPHFATAADRTAGDEIQVVTSDHATALEVVLRLSRTERWSIGLGVGDVREPLPASAREAAGPAFVSAREAVDEAKRSATRFALRRAESASTGDAEEADGVASLVELLIALRDRRTPEGWEICDLMATGIKQTEAAERLEISPQAVSLRLRAAGWRLEQRARPALALVLGALDRSSHDLEEDSDAR